MQIFFTEDSCSEKHEQWNGSDNTCAANIILDCRLEAPEHNGDNCNQQDKYLTRRYISSGRLDSVEVNASTPWTIHEQQKRPGSEEAQDSNR